VQVECASGNCGGTHKASGKTRKLGQTLQNKKIKVPFTPISEMASDEAGKLKD